MEKRLIYQPELVVLFVVVVVVVVVVVQGDVSDVLWLVASVSSQLVALQQLNQLEACRHSIDLKDPPWGPLGLGEPTIHSHSL
jgi:hypothetical protein